VEKENARRALKEIGLSASGFCSESNPSPGTKISTPEFGCELFVAHDICRTAARRQQPKVIHQLSMGRSQQGGRTVHGVSLGGPGSIPIGSASFRRADELGYRKKRLRAARRFKSCATGQTG